MRAGFAADLLVVNGNPLQNLHLLNPYGTDLMTYNGEVIDNYSGVVRPGDPNARHASTAAASSGRSRTASRTTCRR